MTEKIFPTETVVSTILYPFTGLAAGTPVLVRRLMAPHHKRRAEASALIAKQAEIAALAAEAAEAALAKRLVAEADPAKRAAMIQAQEAAEVAARQVELERAKADRKAKRSKLGDSAGAAALMLIVGGPLIWSLVGPWVRPGIGLLVGGWWIAALIHAPSASKTPSKAKAEQDVAASVPAEEEAAGEEADAPAPAPPAALSAADLFTTIEHMVALRALTDEGRGHVHLAEALESLQRHGHYPTHDAREFGALVRAAGLPVERGIRVSGRTPSPGFTASSMTASLGRSPRLPPQPARDLTPEAV
ncbi:hypothetical protein ACFVVL_34805 [Kitasatospora sp. NPDC058115]|uniref:hypothetical protein n=1 Tax=Kitasatospora sp. NPDC058115 TaxID=3346347 RepID=UPI0036DEA830